MAHIVMADDGIAFDGRSAETGPLGGAETAFVALAEALARRGHRVEARNRCPQPLVHNEVEWMPLARGLPLSCDFFIGNRGHRMIGAVAHAKRRLFWLHNPARYLHKARLLLPLAFYRPTIVVTGRYHAGTVPVLAPREGIEVIPYGLLDAYRRAETREPPPPRAVFTSNPLRGLDWLLELWTARIAPAVPEAELHIYAGPAVYGGLSGDAGQRMKAVLARADALHAFGVRRHEPVDRETLAEVLAGSRVMLYRGDPGETFCLALAEAQAMGVPAIVTRLGCVAERIVDGMTGRVAAGDDDFVAAAVAVLREDELWSRWHHNALATQRGLSWDDVAQRFEALMS